MADECPGGSIECPICKGPILNPYRTKCDHTFCEICLNSWFANHPSCPLCRRSLKDGIHGDYDYLFHTSDTIFIPQIPGRVSWTRVCRENTGENHYLGRINEELQFYFIAKAENELFSSRHNMTNIDFLRRLNGVRYDKQQEIEDELSAFEPYDEQMEDIAYLNDLDFRLVDSVYYCENVLQSYWEILDAM